MSESSGQELGDCAAARDHADLALALRGATFAKCVGNRAHVHPADPNEPSPMNVASLCKSRLLPCFTVLLPAALLAQNPFHGNGAPSAYVEISPARVGGTLTIGFGSPTTPVPVAILGLSDGLGPIPVPGFGIIGLDILSPNYLALALGTDASGHAFANVPLGPGITSLTPPLFVHAASLEANALSLSKTVRLEFANGDGWEPVASLGAARQLHTATALGTGSRDNVTEVLLCGGALNSFMVPTPLADAELFSPLTNATTPLPAMSLPRASHRAVRLQDGRVLVAGGVTTGGLVTASCEFFDPTTLAFTPAPSMAAPRGGHAMTLLDDGRVLVSGGVASWVNVATNFISQVNTAQDTAEVFDPVANSWTTLPNMASKRLGHSQTKLLDGRVLVVSGIYGGYAGANPWSTNGQITRYTTSCEIFDPSTNTFTATAPLTRPNVGLPTGNLDGRAYHGASVLPSGNVLVSGGFLAMLWAGVSNTNDETMATDFCDVWNVATGTWSSTVSLPIAAAFHSQEQVGNRALISGGYTNPLVNLPATAQTLYHDGTVVTPLANIGTDSGIGIPSSRGAATLTRLHTGTFLIYGGGAWPNTLGTGFVYTPQ